MNLAFSILFALSTCIKMIWSKKFQCLGCRSFFRFWPIAKIVICTSSCYIHMHDQPRQTARWPHHQTTTVAKSQHQFNSVTIGKYFSALYRTSDQHRLPVPSSPTPPSAVHTSHHHSAPSTSRPSANSVRRRLQSDRIRAPTLATPSVLPTFYITVGLSYYRTMRGESRPWLPWAGTESPLSRPWGRRCTIHPSRSGSSRSGYGCRSPTTRSCLQHGEVGKKVNR